MTWLIIMKPLLYDTEEREKEDIDEAVDPCLDEDVGMAVQSMSESGDPISGLLLLVFGDGKEKDEVVEGVEEEDERGWAGVLEGGVARDADPDPLGRELVLEAGLVAPLLSGLMGLILRYS